MSSSLKKEQTNKNTAQHSDWTWIKSVDQIEEPSKR